MSLTEKSPGSEDQVAEGKRLAKVNTWTRVVDNSCIKLSETNVLVVMCNTEQNQFNTYDHNIDK